MFTLIKRLQELLSKLKRNKGLWFTSLSVISIAAIFFCMYIIMTMTDKVSQDVYQSMSNSYELNLNAKFEQKQKQFQKLVIPILQNQPLLNSIETNNKEIMNQFQNRLNDEFIKSGFSDLNINFISTLSRDQIFRNTINSIITSKIPLFGSEVLTDGVFMVYLYPLIKDGNVFGVIEIKESIHNLKAMFAQENSEYTFILDKKMLTFISLEAKTGKYKDVNQNFTIENTRYDSRFAGLLSEINDDTFKVFLEKKYLVYDGYYRSVKKVTDINGVDIGLIIVGESTELSGGFVNIADNMTKQVTTVALGLIIAIILFLF
jgi:hypothetical protein